MDKTINFKELFNKLKKKFDKQGESLLLAELAVILLIAVIAINYLYNVSYNKFSTNETIKTWDYIYTNHASEEFIENLNVANSLTPMSEEKVASYLHFKTKIEQSDKDRTLILKTDHSPVKILVNDKEVYNNYYGKADYVGNTYNAIVIPASEVETDVKISAFLPFTANVEAYLIDGTVHPAYHINGGAVFAGIIIFAGIISLIFLIYMRTIKRKKIHFLSVVFLLVLFGFTLLINSLTRCSYYLNLSNFYNVTLALENLCVLILLFESKKVIKIKNKSLSLLMVLELFLILASFVPTKLLFFKLIFITCTLVSIAIFFILITATQNLLNRRVQHAKSMFLMVLFLALFDIIGDVMINIMRYRSTFSFCKEIGLFIFICYYLFIEIITVFEYTNPEDIQQKIEQHGSYVKKVAELIKSITVTYSEEQACKIISDGIYDLCKEMNKIPENKEMMASALIKQDGDYKVVYSISNPGAINSSAIENRCVSGERFCIYNETYFDMFFANEGESQIIFHFENIENGLDKFFTSLMDTIYSCIKAAHINSAERAIYSDMQIFVDLAKNYETAIGTNSDHLDSVCYYTRSILEEMGYPESVCEIVSNAAMLHDIGKIAIPYEITTKNTLLSEDERTIMKKHTDFGNTLLSVFDSEFLQVASAIARDHHEKYDGTGYNNIKGEDIDKFARVVSVADVIDALLAKRSYKDPWPIEKVIDYIESNSGKMFDPTVVAAMEKCLDKIKNNSRSINNG